MKRLRVELACKLHHLTLGHRVLAGAKSLPDVEIFPIQIVHHGISFRSRQNLPVSLRGASVASQTIVSAPCATVRVAPAPPMSVCTQPGQTELTAMPGRAAASCRVTAFNAAFEIEYAGAQCSMSFNWPAPLE